MTLELVDKYRQERWYQQRFLFSDLIKECELFQRLGLKFSPLDVVNVLFRCKLAFALATEKEYDRRTPGVSYRDEYNFVINWADKANGIDAVIDQYLERIDAFIEEKTLLSGMSEFDARTIDPKVSVTSFFEGLFTKISAPFVIFLEDDQIVAKHKTAEPNLISYSEAEAKRYFCSPSLGFRTIGSSVYAQLYASAWLRTFFNMLRIGAFIYRPQIDFGMKVEFSAPTFPTFLGSRSFGAYSWNEDAKKPWERIPDGCLFLSFGYRGLSNMWLDERIHAGIEKFMLEHKVIFQHLQNPWTDQNLNDIAPALEILSSATQTPDLGAKILLIYCCLEHLFIPKDRGSDINYIIGAINAMDSSLLPWFHRLYKVRCAYAHKGYVLKDEEVQSLVLFESMGNIMKLLVMKITKK